MLHRLQLEASCGLRFVLTPLSTRRCTPSRQQQQQQQQPLAPPQNAAAEPDRRLDQPLYRLLHPSAVAAAGAREMSAFGGARGVGARPPEKGIFPLDHFGECKQVADAYLACLKQHATDASACKQLAKQYLECRMERNLMAKQDLAELGFKQGSSSSKGGS